MSHNAPEAVQPSHRKAALLVDQLIETVIGRRSEASNGVPPVTATLTRPAVRNGLLLLTITTLTVLAWRKRNLH
ncbi:hypothetical protein ACFYYB_26685 [Streptomyces sp. NPDC002886]|uniref:hypothetical protein n=1 Tax=Streptomyces sp. NPDC002886 TaxID=3364667 RepID=UPI0036A541B3